MKCSRFVALIARRRSGLTDAEKLRLEEHLAGCGACDEAARSLSALATISDQMVQNLPEAKRDQIIARALRSESDVRPPVRIGWAWPALATAVASGAIFFFSQAHSEAPRLVPVFHERVQIARVEPDRALEAHQPTTVALAHARVRFDSRSRARWKPKSRTIHLERGSVSVSVDPKAKKSFRVQTSHFAVEVIGTIFQVSPSGVDVQAGRVQVLGLDGRLLADLRANESWSRSATVEEPRSPTPHQDTRTPRSPRVSFGAVLRQARRALADGESDKARRIIRRVTQSKRASRRLRAEAAMLLAESAAVDGNHAEAVRRYLDVVDRYESLPAAETALFAASRTSRGPEARRLLRRYLETYPDGRFAREAQKRLRIAD